MRLWGAGQDDALNSAAVGMVASIADEVILKHSRSQSLIPHAFSDRQCKQLSDAFPVS